MGAREVNPESARRVAVVTGSRAEFGLLAPVMRAVEVHEALQLCTIVTGTHLLGPVFSREEVSGLFRVDAEVAMQQKGKTGRVADAVALGRGIAGIAGAIGELRPEWVIVLGDRIEALAGAAAGSVAGVCVGHIHGGDRAEGIADEAIRHAITKLAHVHFAATERSGDRIERMGEDARRVHVVGSPAMDGLEEIAALGASEYERLGRPLAVFLMHPERGEAEDERNLASCVLHELGDRFGGRVLCLHPNFDAGREGILRAIEEVGGRYAFTVERHLERPAFVGLLRRVGRERGLLVGNSSAGLIEAAALDVAVVDVGVRQGGRERPWHVVHAPGAGDVGNAIGVALVRERGQEHPYGDGRAGHRIAGIISRTDPRESGLLRKRCTF